MLEKAKQALKTGVAKTAKFIDKISDSKVTRFAINQAIKDYGELIDLRIDRESNQISTTLHLHGDENSITVNITDYLLKKGEESTTMTIQSANSDRQWINAILEKQVMGKEITIPEEHAHIVDEFLKK